MVSRSHCQPTARSIFHSETRTTVVVYNHRNSHCNCGGIEQVLGKSWQGHSKGWRKGGWNDGKANKERDRTKW